MVGLWSPSITFLSPFTFPVFVINCANFSIYNYPPENPKPRKSRRNAKKLKYDADEDDSNTRAGPCNGDWLSKDLLEFVTHMRNGDTSTISQFEIQDLFQITC
ncbi:hypothetical protein Tco_0684566 [Tanacetum coccineum]